MSKLLAIISLLAGSTHAIICVIPGVCPTITSTTTALKTQTQTHTVTTTPISDAVATPTAYAALEVFTNDVCQIDGLLLTPAGTVALSDGICKNIEDAYSNPEALNSERLTKVTDQFTSQNCLLKVWVARGCPGQADGEVSLVPVNEGRACNDGSIRGWTGDAADTDDQAHSYMLECSDA